MSFTIICHVSVQIFKTEKLFILTAVFVDSPTEFTVDTRALPKKSEATVTCKITNPSGAQTATAVTKAKDGTHKVAFTPFEEG